MKDPAGLMLSLTVNAYWTCVLLLAAIRRLRQRQGVGLLPRTRSERILWAFWVPVIVAWNVLPLVALNNHREPFGLPDHLRSLPAIEALRFAAASLALFCYLLTLHCWIRMGRSWSLAVVPDRHSSLVQTGVFGLVRHPIYSLSIVLMLASLVVTATPFMALVAAVHVSILVLKARGEEQFLLNTHGQAYREYTRRTGRFLPIKYPSVSRSL